MNNRSNRLPNTPTLSQRPLEIQKNPYYTAKPSQARRQNAPRSSSSTMKTSTCSSSFQASSFYSPNEQSAPNEDPRLTSSLRNSPLKSTKPSGNAVTFGPSQSAIQPKRDQVQRPKELFNLIQKQIMDQDYNHSKLNSEHSSQDWSSSNDSHSGQRLPAQSPPFRRMIQLKENPVSHKRHGYSSSFHNNIEAFNSLPQNEKQLGQTPSKEMAQRESTKTESLNQHSNQTQFSSPFGQYRMSFQAPIPSFKRFGNDMDCILPPANGIQGVFLGNIEAARNIPLLKSHGISAVLTAAYGTGISYTSSEIQIHRVIPADDTESFNISLYFQEAIEFLEDTRDTTNVLVHCFAGMSRSASLLIAYLIHKNNWALGKALAFCQNKRPIVQPNPGFLKQLRKFENDHFEKRKLGDWDFKKPRRSIHV